MVVGRLVFDFARHSVEKTIRVKQFDSETRNLLVVLLNDGEPYEMPKGAIVRIECKKSDGEEILNDCTYVEKSDYSRNYRANDSSRRVCRVCYKRL